MKSLLLSSLASIAIRSVYAYPSDTVNAPKFLSRREDFPFHEVLNTSKQSRTFRKLHDLRGVNILMQLAEYFSFARLQEDPSLISPPQGSLEDTATAQVKLTMPEASFRLSDDHYVGDNGIAHFYFKQTVNNVDVDNADFNVNIDRNGKVFSFGHSFYEKDDIPTLQKRNIVEPAVALKLAIRTLQLPVIADNVVAEPKADRQQSFTFKQTSGTISEPEARLVYFQTKTDGLKLAWRIETDINTNWIVAYVDAETAEKIYHIVDYAAAANYEV